MSGRRTIALQALDIALYGLIPEHHEEITRELKLVDADAEGPASRRSAVLDLLGGRFLELLAPLNADIARGISPGAAVADVEITLDPDEVRLLRRLHDLLCEIDEAARAGELLALPLPAPAAALRLWIVEQAERQVLRGLPPQSWTIPSREGQVHR